MAKLALIPLIEPNGTETVLVLVNGRVKRASLAALVAVAYAATAVETLAQIDALRNRAETLEARIAALESGL